MTNVGVAVVHSVVEVAIVARSVVEVAHSVSYAVEVIFTHGYINKKYVVR